MIKALRENFEFKIQSIQSSSFEILKWRENQVITKFNHKLTSSTSYKAIAFGIRKLHFLILLTFSQIVDQALMKFESSLTFYARPISLLNLQVFSIFMSSWPIASSCLHVAFMLQNLHVCHVPCPTTK